MYQYTRPKTVKVAPTTAVEFGAIVDKGFTEKDNQSALTQQQMLIATLTKEMNDLKGKMQGFKKETEQRIRSAKLDTASLVEDKVRREMQSTVDELKAKMEAMQSPASPPVDGFNDGGEAAYPLVGGDETFGQARLPPRPLPSSDNNPNLDTLAYPPRKQRSPLLSISLIAPIFRGRKRLKRPPNHGQLCPDGHVCHGGRDGRRGRECGRFRQGDTTPMVFQTLNNGILPNGQPSQTQRLHHHRGDLRGDLVVTGQVRTHRMSCIFDNKDILDVAVKGTVFNFGRNGIRGTTILKNGKVVQMAGISGILTGLGEAGKGLSETTSTSALGSTSSVSGQDIGLNWLGNATASVGAKLADYYIGLAEMYHPIVEINPGSVVNIVFLEGFPLDPLEAAEYEQAQAQEQSSQSNQLMEVISNVTQNPLANQISAQGIKCRRRRLVKNKETSCTNSLCFYPCCSVAARQA
ncbi:TrbI/VirB10 family protein [Vibrio lentus]|uniref:TrbI/VirB10 family protein n=1 Tax=Vibrio lentus TaxID=136468 RepID=UPI0039AFE4B5